VRIRFVFEGLPLGVRDENRDAVLADEDVGFELEGFSGSCALVGPNTGSGRTFGLLNRNSPK